MNFRTTVSVISGIALLGFVNVASAADLPPQRGPAVVPPQPAAPTVVESAYRWYIRGDLGVGFTEDIGGTSVNEAFLVGGGIGVRLSDVFRVDITTDYQLEANVGGGVSDVSVFTVLGNLYADLPLGWFITPYVGIGAGYANVDLDGLANSDEFAWAVTAGASADLAPNIALDVNYRYLDTGKTNGVDVDVHQIRAGLRFYF